MEEPESSATASLSVRSFVAARAQEIIALSLQIASSNAVTNKGLVFQHVPKHMRRRAVSHNVKRLPKRLQQAHLGQLIKSSGGPQKKPKKPNRKYRRRKSNLLLEYNRRQRNVKWLETHIWHAKRFHMSTKWNYKIPIAPCDKGYRAIYRAFHNYSAMRDMSFYCCLEIMGSSTLIGEKFKHITSQSVDLLSVAARYYVNGQREGRLHIYSESTYPYGYIGEANFIWVEDSILWLWIHPGCKQLILDQLINIFQLFEKLQFSNANATMLNLDIPSDQMKLEPKKLSSSRQWTSDENGVVLTDLEGGLNRIRLYGPTTFSVLKETLRLNTGVDKDSSAASSTWCNEFWRNNEDLLKLQNLVWLNASSSHDFPNQVVLPLVVRDPRIFLPQSRSKLRDQSSSHTPMDTDQDFNRLLDEYLEAAPKPLANKGVRSRVLCERMSDLELSRRRGRVLIPGSQLELGAEENQIPILLIRQFGCGWDIILPAGWALSFWISFSYRCVRTFGHRDAVHHTIEFGSVHSPELFTPDSLCSHQETEAEGIQKLKTFFSFPPAKRSNLVRLKCPFPFRIDWKLLLRHSWRNFLSTPVGDEVGSSSEIFVLRDTNILQTLSQACGTYNKEVFDFITLIPEIRNCLVGVGVQFVGKGISESQSIICLPESEKEIVEKYELPVEPVGDCKDLEHERKLLRQKHRQEMAFLRKKRKKLRKQEINVETPTVQMFNSTDLSYSYNSAMQSLYLSPPNSTLESMSRKPFGFVTVGAESFKNGKCVGFGYVTLLGLQRFFQIVKSWKTKDTVLLRDTANSLDYRKAKLKIFTT